MIISGGGIFNRAVKILYRLFLTVVLVNIDLSAW